MTSCAFPDAHHACGIPSVCLDLSASTPCTPSSASCVVSACSWVQCSGIVEPHIHLTAVKSDAKNGPDLHNIFVKVCTRTHTHAPQHNYVLETTAWLHEQAIPHACIANALHSATNRRSTTLLTRNSSNHIERSWGRRRYTSSRVLTWSSASSPRCVLSHAVCQCWMPECCEPA